jgi:hypothetical protein
VLDNELRIDNHQIIKMRKPVSAIMKEASLEMGIDRIGGELIYVRQHWNDKLMLMPVAYKTLWSSPAALSTEAALHRRI